LVSGYGVNDALWLRRRFFARETDAAAPEPVRA
jgi:hypothetical protein